MTMRINGKGGGIIFFLMTVLYSLDGRTVFILSGRLSRILKYIIDTETKRMLAILYALRKWTV